MVSASWLLESHDFFNIFENAMFELKQFLVIINRVMDIIERPVASLVSKNVAKLESRVDNESHFKCNL